MLEVDWVFVAAIVASVCAVIAAESLEEIRDRVGEMGDTLARIETRQAEDEKHVLRARDLGAIHEKINRLAEDLAATRAQSTTQSQMIGEQLRLLQRLVQDNLSSSRGTRR